jgi:protein-tyrosine phosphatase
MLDITQIEDGLWQGGYPGKELPKEIHIVVNLSSERPPESYHEELKGLLWMPTPDGIYPGLLWLDTIVDYVNAARQDKQNVLVHCLAGRSRSTLIVAAYLMRSKRLTVDEALALIRTQRPVIGPASVYLTALQEYAKYIGVQ